MMIRKLHILILITSIYGCGNYQHSNVFREEVPLRSQDYNYTSSSFRKIKLNENIHYVPLERWLKNIDYLDSVKIHTSFINDIPFDADKTKKDLFYYLDRALIINFGNVQKNELLTRYNQNKLKRLIDFEKETFLYNEIEKEKARKKIILDESNLFSSPEVVEKKNINDIVIKWKKNKNIKNRIINYTLPPYFERECHFEKLKIKYNIDSLEYSFFVAEIPNSPTYKVGAFSGSYPIATYPITIENSDKHLSYSYKTTLGIYSQTSFLVAIPNKEILANLKQQSKYPDREPCIDCLPKLFLSKDMVDYEYQKIFLLEFLKQRYKEEDEAIRVFLHLLLSPDYKPGVLSNSDIRVTKKEKYYEWQCRSASFFNCTIKGTIKGTKIKGKIILSKKIESEMIEMKKQGFPIKRQWLKFTL